ncbi:CopG family transcriptional regulator [Streptococcus sp. SQ9-PEA]|uniref:CopG family transcriptional regulator n=2 Tax=Streptococcus sciuri TaxID=2973939 RepID=A0ABT2F7R1_9STRE|nr:CopG family transcriptional regulator [Streptococcus sciuri]
MTTKMGRPIKGDTKRNKHMAIRLTEAEFDKITQLSQKLGLSKADTVVRAVDLLEKSEK